MTEMYRFTLELVGDDEGVDTVVVVSSGTGPATVIAAALEAAADEILAVQPPPARGKSRAELLGEEFGERLMENMLPSISEMFRARGA